MAQIKSYEDFKAHFSNEINEDFKAFVRDDNLLHSRYLFVRRLASTIQRGYCTHCRKDYVITSKQTLKHNDNWQCEKCKSLVFVKHAGRPRGKMLDTGYVIWYEKSQCKPDAITATGYNVSFDYRADMKGVAYYTPVVRYVFEIGKPLMMYRNHHFTGAFNTRVIRYDEGWSFAKQAWSMIGKNSYTRNSSQSIASIQKAVQGTPFSYADWGMFSEKNLDLIYFFTTFSKYPFIEYLWKMGMAELVRAMVEGKNLYRSINLRGKNMERILGLSKKEIKEWKKSGVEMEPVVLHTYKWFRKQGVPISWETADKCDHLLNGTYYFEKLEYIQNFLPLDRIVRYVNSQMRKDPKRNSSITGTIGTWKDYLEECKELGMDLASETVLLPNDLNKAHSKTTRAVKVKKDEVINQKIANQQPRLQKYCFEFEGLFIRPAISSIEMFDEGKALDHCVGRYADRYAKGEIVIMFIRRADQPKTSFYTLELYVKDNIVTQCRGLRNKDMTAEVRAFVDAFTAEKLKKKKPASKTINRQEVAV
ncbi:PcfJ domain-containing protein [Bacillus sp. T33-2]|uniref:PcfJ domain-containing protein n=1 Tax=Bacillus sp. T33-2 TaxID=2054168 RepID=UPI000C771492|nr:PcfJ domain-containing protein [Bacillus sp. T33-2]PLR93219.1 hypothetical protein CVD19_19640 [Bacillus sp. T33-2]